MGLDMFAVHNGFWKKHREQHFKKAEIALFDYLLDQANQRWWKMPFEVATEQARLDLELTPRLFNESREALKERRIIDFAPGHNGNRLPAYTFLEGTTTGITEGTTEGTTAIPYNKDINRNKRVNYGTRQFNSSKRRGVDIEENRGSSYSAAFVDDAK